MAEKINQVDEHNLDITIDTHSRNEMMIIERSVNRMLALIRNLLAETSANTNILWKSQRLPVKRN